MKDLRCREHKGIMPLWEMVLRSAEEFGERPALVARERQGDRTITYAGLGDQVTRLAQNLLASGLSPGRKCAILGPNSPEWALAYLGIAGAGAICVPLDSLLSDNEIRHLLADAKVDMAFVAPRFLECVLETRRDFPGPKKIVALTRDAAGLPKGVIPFDEMCGKPGRKKSLPEQNMKNTAVIIYTSGTTGRPKGVMLSQENIVSDVAACYRAIPLENARLLSVLPLHHTFECTCGFLFPLYSGYTVTYARSLKSRDILEDLKASRANIMLGVPLLFQKMLEGIHRGVGKQPAVKRAAFHSLMKAVKLGEKMGRKDLGVSLFKGLREKAGLGSIELLVSGGAPLMPSIPLGFRRLGIKMIQGYGLTETSPVLTMNPLDAPIDESIGKPLAPVEFRVFDPDENGVGELAFKGPMVMKGYYRDPEATSAVLDPEEWFRTGDLGYQDRKGYIYICGRAKNLIVTPAGKNVYPEEIESELNLSPYILESMVYGHELETGGEEVRALIVPDYETIGEQAAAEDLTEKEIHSLVSREVKKINQRVGSYKRIKAFTLREEELPKTSTRKIKRHLIAGR